jgi:predicted RNA binding protein YcfA (HicA-like mRNA interferase family)
MPPKIRDVLQQLREAGWQQVQQTGSHRQFKHPVHPVRVTKQRGQREYRL